MALFEVISGNIAEGQKYQVVGGTSINYNGNTINSGDFFTGVPGVTTYTKTSGIELVTDASEFEGISLGIENDFFIGHFSDESKFLGISLGVEELDGKSQIIEIKYYR